MARASTGATRSPSRRKGAAAWARTRTRSSSSLAETSRRREHRMPDSPRPGAIHWIDHFVVTVDNMLPWERFMEDVLGGTVHHRGGLSTAEMLRGGQVRTFYNVRHHESGGFLPPRLRPQTGGPGRILPRWGFYVRPEDIDAHRRHFDAHQVAYRDPVRTSE